VRRRFRLTPEARFDLLSIRQFIARDDSYAADRMIKRFETAFQLLAQFPRNGHKRDNAHTSEPVLFWPLGSYVVVYQPEPKPVLIVRVFYGARDLDALL
jgi:plasmid stabilization system protein ParE